MEKFFPRAAALVDAGKLKPLLNEQSSSPQAKPLHMRRLAPALSAKWSLSFEGN